MSSPIKKNITTLKKILYIATSDIHLHTFHRPYIKWLISNGHQVDIAVENRGDNTFEGIKNKYYLDFPRSLLRKSLFKAYKELKRIIDMGQYDLVHCHTPIPSMLTRIAARHARKNGTKVLYTAHGFHFYENAPLSRWLIFYTAEFLLSNLTDGIVTINKEDYGYICNKMLHKDSWYIPGIGVDSNRFKPLTMQEKASLRRFYGYNDKQFILLYTAEFIPRKNHEFIIRAVSQIKESIPELKVLFAGKGILMEEMKQLSDKLNLSRTIEFLGFRTDIESLCAISDLGISASKHEGLGLGLVEQMMCKVPVLATVDRGHKELIENGYNGFLFKQNDTNAFIEKLLYYYKQPVKRIEMGNNAFEKAKDFDTTNSLKAMNAVYNFYL